MKKTTPIENLMNVMERLRHPTEGCPWDREQTFSSVAPYTIEEAYEVSDAIEQNDMSSLKEELGDLLLQIVFHSRMAEESGDFDFNEVAQSIADKMIRRHPHVFGEEEQRSREFHGDEWEAQKKRERAEKAQRRGDSLPSILDDVALAFPALMRAEKLGKRAAKAGFEWQKIEPFFNKINDEILELRSELDEKEISKKLVEEELGDILLSVVSLARHLKVDAELALRRSNDKFESRFRFIEKQLSEAGKKPEETSLAEYEALWHEAKQSKQG
ncbi:MAG: nucleoside triphosphate pyrophosphohydrolase [Proteobacteria bacterium]|jgi:MazG family protein|nr:nucleoside triphosphate pyrophosphohydrolase [Pseudomonadota bacterium]MBT5794249.1 nucleoside triphosphate pyrophosphohydrolase [Deltaproteobacteria bacterium]